MSTVTATTLEEVVRDTVAPLLVPGAITFFDGSQPTIGYFPVAGQSPGIETPTPFIIANFQGEAPNPPGTGAGRISNWTMFVYDQPEYRYWRIEDICNALRRTLNGARLPATMPTYTQFLRARYEGRSPYLAENDWNKLYEFVRFSVMGY